uniref:Keratin n=1 Tax=Corvus moneduloides TaxID=1196302 RepID=A0A8C3DQ03_CORMO
MSCNPCCQPCGPCPLANSCNECCVRQCQSSTVAIQPSAVVVTLPGPILSSFPQNTVVGSSTSAAVGSILSSGGGSHHGVLWEGAEDGPGQGHHDCGGLDGHGGALALPDTALIAAVGQWAGAAGLAARVAGHGSGSQVHLAQRAGRSRM